ncbi:hypothetical protein [Megamonas hypermegale]|uniref:hypothetical protein n=1 Tax=Megamonas hypermegale TaxID=158847 RepID=UPI0026F1A97F|nr:hypothetical protein [Megamonas hypermegale]
MRKIFLMVIFAYCLIINSAFASPHENGIDDFYFGQPLEEIQAQYELTDKNFTVEDGAVIYYKANVPTFDFYGLKIDQPVSLGFKDNALYKITFNTTVDSLTKILNQKKMIADFASVQYGRVTEGENLLLWSTNTISLSVRYVAADENSAYLLVSMNENSIQTSEPEENTLSNEVDTENTAVPAIEIPQDMKPIQAQLYMLYQIKLNDTLENTSRQIHLTKVPIWGKPKNTELINYTSPKRPNMFSEILQRNVNIRFYKNNLESVFISFEGDGTQLKEYLISKLGNPATETQNVVLANMTDYSWKNGDYGLSFSMDKTSGHINFYYVPYVQIVTKISLLEYAEGLKSTPTTVLHLEDMIRSNAQYKESFKTQMKNFPEYEQALKEAGMDMSIFN